MSILKLINDRFLRGQILIGLSLTLSGCFLDSKITNLNDPSSKSNNPVLIGETGISKGFVGTSQFKVSSQNRGYRATGFLGSSTQKVSSRSPRGYVLEYSVEVLSQ